MNRETYDKLSAREKARVDSKREARSKRRGARKVDDWRTKRPNTPQESEA